MNSDHGFSDPASVQLARAVERGDSPAIDRLVTTGASVDAMDARGHNLLDWAMQNDRKGAFQKLLELGANPNAVKRSSGSTVVHRAALNPDDEWLRILLQHGGDPGVAEKTGQTPIFRAFAVGHLELLVQAGADLDHRDVLGQTPAVYFADLLLYEFVLRLLRNGASHSTADHSGRDLVSVVRERVPDWKVAREHRQQVINLLRERGASI